METALRPDKGAGENGGYEEELVAIDVDED
jgi:hypothetical protein